MPSWLGAARTHFGLGLSYVEMAMDALAKPVIVAHKAAAAVEGWRRALKGYRGRRLEDRFSRVGRDGGVMVFESLSMRVSLA